MPALLSFRLIAVACSMTIVAACGDGDGNNASPNL